MTSIRNLLSAKRIVTAQTDHSKKRVLFHLSELICTEKIGLTVDTLFSAFTGREKLGSSYIGHGIAVPHVQLADIPQPTGALIHLKQGIQFCQEADQNVDIILGFVISDSNPQTHLKVLAQLANILGQEDTRQQIRQHHDNQMIYQLFNQSVNVPI